MRFIYDRATLSDVEFCCWVRRPPKRGTANVTLCLQSLIVQGTIATLRGPLVGDDSGLFSYVKQV